MRLPNQIRAVACAGWVSILGLGIYFSSSAGPCRSGVIRVRAAVAGTHTAVQGAQDAPARPRTGEPHTGERLGANPASPGFANESLGKRGIVAISVAPEKGLRATPLAPVARSQGVRSAPAEKLTRSLTEEARRGHFQPYVLTGYSHGCILPKWGPEPPPQPMASGEWPVAGLHVAGPPEMAFGTVLEVVYRGLPSRLIVGDRGRAIKGRRLDLFLATCRAARAWGRRTAYVREVR